ncbi:MAG: hypothetical protein QM820_43645 [Minicystis sp.]
MGNDGAQGGEQRLLSVVDEARGRLGRIAGREHLREKGWWVIGAGAVAAALRPLVWRLADEAPLWLGIGRAAGLFAAGSMVAAGALIVIGRRRGPSEVGAARALDGALGSTEVIASGYAFAREGRTEPVVMLARRRAAEMAATARVAESFPLPSLRPRVRSVGVFALALLAALSVGGYERGLVTALIAPPTAIENEAAAELEEAAAELAEQQPKDVKTPTPEKASPKREKSDDKLSGAGPALADKAKEAARAARRGDRRGALEKLEELRAEGKQRSARAGDLGKTLRKVAEALAPPSDEKRSGDGASATAATPSKDAAESMRLLAEKMRSPEGGAAGSGGGESKERMLERLERAAEEARRGAAEGKGQDASEAARALSRAAESLKRGDREAASQALAQAAERAAAMEQARAAAAAEAMAIVEMLEKSGALERAIQMAMLGQDGENQGQPGEGLAMAGEGQDGNGKGGSGEGKGQGGKGGNGKGGKDGSGSGGEGSKQGGGASALRKAILARLAAMGVGSSSQQEGGEASNGSGPHMPDRHRSKRAALAAQGSIRAPSQVGEGPRAIQAINGLGRGTEPPAAYREVFPTYDAAAEEGLADERIPAQRRTAVRRYFQAIRPDQHE